MKQKNRKLSIRMKILIPTSCLIVVICLILGMSAYRNINDGMISVGVEEAQMAAQIATEIIDGDLLQELTPGCENTEEYQSLLAAMRNVQTKFGIAFLYTLYTDGSQVYYGIDTDQTERQKEFGALYEVSYDELAGTFSGNAYVEDYIDNTEDGALISAYLPILDSDGKIIGILGCDYNASNIVKKLKTITGQIIVITIICIVFSLLLLNFIVGKIMKGLRQIDTKIFDLVHSEGDLTHKLEFDFLTFQGI